jgi:hypothetical protein
MKQQPDGFAISFNRYDRTKRWGWKQTKGMVESTIAGHCMRREGFKSRRAALIDLIAEVEARDLAPARSQSSTEIVAQAAASPT